MSKSKATFSIEVVGTESLCPAGEVEGKKNMAAGKIPVISCEGGCIRGEIARLAANMVAKVEPYRRGCHAETFAAPHSAIARWVKTADKVVLIDGCFMRCHGRILENMIDKEKLIQFDALSIYKRYTDRFDIDSVPEAERKEVAQQVTEKVLSDLK
jgi:uncharacterized metal-binding protein